MEKDKQVHLFLFFRGNENGCDNSWALDNGATHHVTNDASHLSQLTSYLGLDCMLVGNGGKVSIDFTRSTILPSCSDIV